MATDHELNVEVRTETGKRKVKRLRAEGKIPAIIYGHGEDSISLAIPTDAFNKILGRGERIVALSGGVSGDAFIREVQWDVYGASVLHVDFTRVSAGEMISTTVVLEIRGVAPGTKMGGVVEQPLHQMEIRCPPRSMTDKVEVNVNELELDKRITVGQLTLPEGAEVVLEADTVVVQCVEKQVLDEVEEAPLAGAVEPEVIGEKKEDSGDDS
jgi:large subunit ribosomal protein L25